MSAYFNSPHDRAIQRSKRLRPRARVYVSVLLVRLLLSEFRRRGLDESALLQGTSVDGAMLANMRSTISTAEWAVMLTRAVELSGDPAFGLAMGQHWSPSKLQVVGPLIAACRSLRQAFALFDRYQLLIGNNIQWSLEEQGGLTYVFCDPLWEHPVATRIGFEAWLGILVGIGRAFLCFDGYESAAVWFKHSEPPYVAEYGRVFECEVFFNQPRYAIAFPSESLDRAQPLSDETVQGVLAKHAELLLGARESQSMAERVWGMLRWEEEIAMIDVHSVAQRLGLGARTLQRQLVAERASLRRLLDEARLRIAQRELRKPGVSIKAAACVLGFSDRSAFDRAFKRWGGQTPAQYVKHSSSSRARAQRNP